MGFGHPPAHNNTAYNNPSTSSGSASAFVATQHTNPFVAHPEFVVDPSWYVDSGTSNHVTADNVNVTNPSSSFSIISCPLLPGHPMVTRGKADIFKPRALVSQTQQDWALTEPTRVVTY